MLAFKDMNSDNIITIGDLFKEWKEYGDRESGFMYFLMNVIDATEKGQNDIDFFNCSRRDAQRVYQKALKISRKNHPDLW